MRESPLVNLLKYKLTGFLVKGMLVTHPTLLPVRVYSPNITFSIEETLK